MGQQQQQQSEDAETEVSQVVQPANSEELRLTYPDLVHHNNINEDNWYCDICLDTGGVHDENGDDE